MAKPSRKEMVCSVLLTALQCHGKENEQSLSDSVRKVQSITAINRPSPHACPTALEIGQRLATFKVQRFDSASTAASSGSACFFFHCRTRIYEWGLCEYVIVHTILGGSPVSHSVDLAGWQAEMASIEIWITWLKAHKPHLVQPPPPPSHLKVLNSFVHDVRTFEMTLYFGFLETHVTWSTCKARIGWSPMMYTCVSRVGVRNVFCKSTFISAAYNFR